MKAQNLIIPSLMIAMVLSTTSCKTPQNIEKTTGAVEISVPFSDSKYKTDKDFFRAKNIGKSIDLATSKKIALQNAKSELAGNIQSIMKAVTDQYTNQRTIGNAQEFENKFEELAREAVMLSVSNVREIGEETFKELDGGFSCWTAIEVGKKEVFDKLDSKISGDAKLKLDYDKQKYEKIFNEEMEKLRQDQ